MLTCLREHAQWRDRLDGWLRFGTRVALVLGNSAYQNVAQLPNPVNDGAIIAAKLKEAGFLAQVAGQANSTACLPCPAARRRPSARHSTA